MPIRAGAPESLTTSDFVGHVAGADALPMARRVLLTDPDVAAVLGTTPNVSASNKPPYPMIRLTLTPGGNDRDYRWLVEQELQVEVLGDLDGSIGLARLRRILYVVLARLSLLPEEPPLAGEPVVTAVRSRGAGGPVPEPTGQRRYVASLVLSVHPERPASSG